MREKETIRKARKWETEEKKNQVQGNTHEQRKRKRDTRRFCLLIIFDTRCCLRQRCLLLFCFFSAWFTIISFAACFLRENHNCPHDLRLCSKSIMKRQNKQLQTITFWRQCMTTNSVRRYMNNDLVYLRTFIEKKSLSQGLNYNLDTWCSKLSRK